MADLDDFDDFVEIAPTTAKAYPSAAITFGTVSLRGGIEKISLSFSAAAIARLDGWPRFAIAWSAKALALRIRADAAGAYEAFKAIKGERYVLRVALPSELRHVPKLKEPAPHRYGEDGRTVFITAPPAFRPPPEPVKPKTHAEMIAAAKAAVPAPEFGSRRNGGAR